MFFFGWGKRNITKVLPNQDVLILTYAYFNIFFVFSTAFAYSYTLATQSEKGWHHKPITKEQAQQLLNGEEFQPHWWWRYGLLVLVVAVSLLITFTVVLPALSST